MPGGTQGTCTAVRFLGADSVQYSLAFNHNSYSHPLTLLVLWPIHFTRLEHKTDKTRVSYSIGWVCSDLPWWLTPTLWVLATPFRQIVRGLRASFVVIPPHRARCILGCIRSRCPNLSWWARRVCPVGARVGKGWRQLQR